VCAYVTHILNRTAVLLYVSLTSFFLLLVSGTVFLGSSLVKVISLYNTTIMVLRDTKSAHALVEGKTNIVGRWNCKQQSLKRNQHEAGN
jgi:hypothetical protein